MKTASLDITEQYWYLSEISFEDLKRSVLMLVKSFYN